MKAPEGCAKDLAFLDVGSLTEDVKSCLWRKQFDILGVSHFLAKT